MRCFPALLFAVVFGSGCQSIPLRTNYDPVGYKPKNPAKVVVKVSLQGRMVYVIEGTKPLLVTATAIGLPNKPTPKGRFRVTNKIASKRSGTYGFWVKGDTIVAGKSSKARAPDTAMSAFPCHTGSNGCRRTGSMPVPCGQSRGHMAASACIRTPLVNSFNSPASALRSTLRKDNPKMPLSAKTPRALKITTTPIPQRVSLFPRVPSPTIRPKI